jgi:hypothetical protein
MAAEHIGFMRFSNDLSILSHYGLTRQEFVAEAVVGTI